MICNSQNYVHKETEYYMYIHLLHLRTYVPTYICTYIHTYIHTQDLSVFPFLRRHYSMTHVLLSPFITTAWTPVVLAIINII